MNNLLIDINNDVTVKFPFKKFIKIMISLVPLSDISGLERIIIQNEVPKNFIKTKQITQAFYFRNKVEHKGHIEIILKNIIDVSIPSYAFEKYYEIGGLLLSEIVFHEIGHHIHFFKRHGIKNKKYEDFADKYAEAGYFNYLILRASKILLSYRLASLNYFLFNKEQRKMLCNARKDLIAFLSSSKNKVLFP